MMAVGNEMDMLKPSAALLCKLGSIAVHAAELTSPDGHAFDRAAMLSVLSDPEVVGWLAAMDAAALLPKTRAQMPHWTAGMSAGTVLGMP
jgi:hypothetical protein